MFNTRFDKKICNLIVVNFRCKPLINTENKLKRGKPPLALATGKNKKFDWMTFIKKIMPLHERRPSQTRLFKMGIKCWAVPHTA